MCSVTNEETKFMTRMEATGEIVIVMNAFLELKLSLLKLIVS